MDCNLDQKVKGHWIKIGTLRVEISSMENGFLESKKNRQEIWDYLEYRESLVKWPSMNEHIKGGTL